MTTATARSFASTIQVTNVWLNDVLKELGWRNRERAYLALRTVLHALRDRLSMEHVAALGAQLPMLVRGFYYEGWRPGSKTSRERKLEQFLAHIRAAFENDPTADPEQIAAAVFRVLQRHVTPGAVEHIVATLPRSVRLLWL